MAGGTAVAGLYFYLVWTRPGLYLPLALVSVSPKQTYSALGVIGIWAQLLKGNQ